MFRLAMAGTGESDGVLGDVRGVGVYDETGPL